MRYLILTLLFLSGLILQSTVFSHLTIAGVKPDIVLILIIFNAILHGPKEGALAGLVGGLLQDLMFGQFLGINILTKLTTGYLFGLLEKKIYKENLLIPLIVVFFGSILNEALSYMFRSAAGISTGDFYYIRDLIVMTAVYNGIITLFIYWKFHASSQKGLLKLMDR